MNKIKQFLSQRNNLILLGIILLAAFLRLYRISDYMTFLGDEGRDVLTVKHILDGDLTLLGPRSSAADFFYGPIYFYMITPFLWLFRYDPVGPAVFIALLGIVTVGVVYYVGKRWMMSQKAGLIAAALYTVSPVVLAYSRSSWNPNPLPFVSLLALYVLYLGLKKPRWWLFGIVGLLLGIALQLQYLALFLCVIIAVITAIGTYMQKKDIVLSLIKRYLLLFAGFLTGFSPFLAFEVVHGFPNTKTILNFLLGKYPSVGAKGDFIGQIIEMFFKLFGRLITRYPEATSIHVKENPQLLLWYAVSIVVGLLSVFFAIKIKDKYARMILLVWVILGVGLFGFYKKELYDYYMGFMFPLPFFLVAHMISLPFERTKSTLLKVIALVSFITLFVLNLVWMPFRFEPNRQKDQVKDIAEFVLSKTDNKPFNFALITPGNSDHGYRYFFEINNRKPVTIENNTNDPERKTVTDQLLVVCEDVDCQPLGDPLFEVAAFGRAEVAGEWKISVVKVYKLVHYSEKDK